MTRDKRREKGPHNSVLKWQIIGTPCKMPLLNLDYSLSAPTLPASVGKVMQHEMGCFCPVSCIILNNCMEYSGLSGHWGKQNKRRLEWETALIHLKVSSQSEGMERHWRMCQEWNVNSTTIAVRRREKMSTHVPLCNHYTEGEGGGERVRKKLYVIWLIVSRGLSSFGGTCMQREENSWIASS